MKSMNSNKINNELNNMENNNLKTNNMTEKNEEIRNKMFDVNTSELDRLENMMSLYHSYYDKKPDHYESSNCSKNDQTTICVIWLILYTLKENILTKEEGEINNFSNVLVSQGNEHLVIDCKDSGILLKIIEVLKRSINDEVSLNAFDVYKCLSLISLDWLVENFEEFASKIGRKISYSMVSNLQDYASSELFRLALSSLKDEKEPNAFNLLGFGEDFRLSSNKVIKYLSIYSDPIDWLARVYAGLFKNEDPSYYEFLSPEDKFEMGDQKVDYFLFNPGYFDPILNGGSCLTNNSTQILDEAWQHLSDKGQMIVVLHSDHYFGDYSLNEFVKKSISELDALDTVMISNLKNENSSDWMVFIFNKQKSHPNEVKFIEASTELGKAAKEESFIDAVKSEDSNVVSFISNERIAQENYILKPALLHMSEIEVPQGFSLKKIKDFATIYNGQKMEAGTYRRVVSGMLNESPYDLERTYKEVLPFAQEEGFIALNQDLLLISLEGALRPTLFKFNGSNICSDSSIAAFVLNDSIYHPYFTMELSKDYIADRLKYRMYGTYNALQMFLETNILVPNKEIQVSEYNKKIVEYKNSQLTKMSDDKIKAIKEQAENFEHNMHIRKHAMAQVLNELSPSIDLLLLSMDKHNDTLSKSDIISSRTGATVGDYFTKIKNSINRIEGMVDSLIDGVVYGFPIDINLKDFIGKYINSHLNSKYKIEVNYSDSYDIAKNIGEINDVKIDPANLQQALDNILANAERWGFTDSSREDYCVRINVDVKRQKIDAERTKLYSVLYISNNGNPLDESVDPNSIFNWGVGGHTGLGAWQTKNIIEHFNGKVNSHINPNDPEGFEVGFDLEFESGEEKILWKE